MPARSALVLTVDGLHSGFLGPYGNSWIHTPEFNALAAESFILDQAMIAHPQLERAFDALWSVGREARHDGPTANISLAEALSEANVVTCLITDDVNVAGHPLAAPFSERLLVTPLEPHAAAHEVAETGLAQVFAAAADRLSTIADPFLLWVHLRGLTAPWDAPNELREQYADPEDPPTPRFVTVPDQALAKNHDPDDLLGVVHSYAGQISLVDTCLGVMRQGLAERRAAAATLFCVLGTRGFSLGEHGRVGGLDAPLYSELMQIPWILRFPDGLGALDRSSALVQQQDLPATLLAWWKLGEVRPLTGSHDLAPLLNDRQTLFRDRVYVSPGPTEHVLRTPAWFLRATGSASSPELELFAKPSDRWDVNQVADRAANIAEQMAAALLECQNTAADAGLSPLDSALLEPID